MSKRASEWLANTLIDTFNWARFWWYNTIFYKQHLRVWVKDNKIGVSLMSHEDFLRTVVQRLKRRGLLQPRTAHDFARFFTVVQGANFVIMQGKHESPFMQFALDKGLLTFDFPIRIGNGHAKYFLPMVGLLALMQSQHEVSGVTNQVIRWPLRGYCNPDPAKGLITFNFNGDYALAGSFMHRALKEVFKIKPEDFKINLG